MVPGLNTASHYGSIQIKARTWSYTFPLKIVQAYPQRFKHQETGIKYQILTCSSSANIRFSISISLIKDWVSTKLACSSFCRVLNYNCYGSDTSCLKEVFDSFGVVLFYGSSRGDISFEKVVLLNGCCPPENNDLPLNISHSWFFYINTIFLTSDFQN